MPVSEWKGKNLTAMSNDECLRVCDEVRQELLRAPSLRPEATSASNLGTVELTVALHRVFDFEKIGWCSMWDTSVIRIKC